MQQSNLSLEPLSFWEILCLMRAYPESRGSYLEEFVRRAEKLLVSFDIAREERKGLIDWLETQAEIIVLPEKVLFRHPTQQFDRAYLIAEGSVDCYVNDPTTGAYIGSFVKSNILRTDRSQEVALNESLGFSATFEKHLKLLAHSKEAPSLPTSVRSLSRQSLGAVLNTRQEDPIKLKEAPKNCFKITTLTRGSSFGGTQLVLSKLNEMYYVTGAQTCIIGLPRDVFNSSFRKAIAAKMASDRHDISVVSGLKNAKFIEWIRQFVACKSMNAGSRLIGPGIASEYIYFLKTGIVEVTYQSKDRGKQKVVPVSIIRDSAFLNVSSFAADASQPSTEGVLENRFPDSVYVYAVKSEEASFFVVPRPLFDYGLNLFPDVIETLSRMKAVREAFYLSRIRSSQQVSNSPTKAGEAAPSMRPEGRIIEIINKKKAIFREKTKQAERRKLSRPIPEDDECEKFKRQLFLKRLKDNHEKRAQEKSSTRSKDLQANVSKESASSRTQDVFLDTQALLREPAVMIRKAISNSSLKKLAGSVSRKQFRLRAEKSSSPDVLSYPELRVSCLEFLNPPTSTSAAYRLNSDRNKLAVDVVMESTPYINFSSLARNAKRPLSKINRSESVESGESPYKQQPSPSKVFISRKDKRTGSQEQMRSWISAKDITGERGSKMVAGFCFETNVRSRLRTAEGPKNGDQTRLSELRVDSVSYADRSQPRIPIRVGSIKQAPNKGTLALKRSIRPMKSKASCDAVTKIDSSNPHDLESMNFFE